MSTSTTAAPSAAVNQAELDDVERAGLDAVIDELHAGERAWAALSLAERAGLLHEVHAATAAVAEDWTRIASQTKGLSPSSQAIGEEWISGPYAMLGGVSTLAHSLDELAKQRSPLETKKFGTAPGGRLTVPILPATAHEAILLHGFSGEIWLQPGIDEEHARRSAGLGALQPESTNGIGLVLGAGNITSIAPLDVLYELVANNRVVLLKLNPTLAALESAYVASLAPLIAVGAVRIVQGGGAAGSYLAHHDGIDHVHITGSAATHDVVVYGPGDEGRARKAANDAMLEKPITSELGGVSPIIVVPGEWNANDLKYQAEHVATMRLHNGGYNCIAGQVLIVSSDWPQKDAFLAQINAAMDAAPARTPWYPGSADRVQSARDAHPNAVSVGPDHGRLIIEASTDAASVCSTEYFAPVLGVVELPGNGQHFLDAAIAKSNDDLNGTLGANILIEPNTRTQLGTGFREALAELRYGTIAVNTWTGLGFLTAAASWGAFPGHTLADVQSGRGVVHNALLIDRPERTVVTGPFRPFPHSVAHGENALFPKPPWFVSSRSAASTGRRLTEFASKPSWAAMPRVFAAAFRA